MKYHYHTGVDGKRKSSKLLVILPLVSLIGGGYLLLNTLAPSVPGNLMGDVEVVAKKLKQRQPDLKVDRLYVPKLGIDVAIVTGVDESTLEGGAWHRQPQNGDPITGGNYVLAAHRFNLGLTPQQTRAKSPFYYIDKLKTGDDIYVDYRGVRYAYKVDKSYKVNQDQVSIEAQSDNAKLTMYSCDLRGPEAGREVVEAKPVGTIAWTDGKPRLETLQ